MAFYPLLCGHTAEVGPCGPLTGRAWCDTCEVSVEVRQPADESRLTDRARLADIEVLSVSLRTALRGLAASPLTVELPELDAETLSAFDTTLTHLAHVSRTARELSRDT